MTGAGIKSPLLALEPTIVSIIIQMARIRQCLTPSRGIRLVNALIDGTQHQKEFTDWKAKHCSDVKGSVGRGYWRGFMKRNGHLICSKRGAKYELDRASWSTYANFLDMYVHVISEMVNAGLAIELDSPVWMDRSGNTVDETKAFGCKVTHDILYPDMCLVGDEVGGNISMKGDGHAGGKLYLCEKGQIPQQKTSSKDKHFTLMGLTNLKGEPVMCILVIAGKKPKAMVEMGIDSFQDMIGLETDEDFFEKNSGEGKLFPGGPTCLVKGIRVPCFIRWSEKGSMTSEILKEALETLDCLKVFDRVEGRKPFLLVDGHGSRFELPFLSYINDPDHEWVVCIGVPYGTGMWQVGDSKEQNGSYNIAMTNEKAKLLEERESKCINPTLETYDIIPLVNRCWPKSFGRKDKNQNAIADRGWYPFNRNLLTLPEVRATMTMTELEEELVSSIVISTQTTTCTTLAVTKPTPTFDPQYLNAPPPPADSLALNYSTGTSAFCLDSLVQHSELMKSRERVKNERDNGKTVKEKIQAAKRVTAGVLFKASSCRIGKDVFEVQRDHAQERLTIEMAKLNKVKQNYLLLKDKAAAVLALGKTPDKWSAKELKIVVAPLKRKEDGAMPKLKKELLEAYQKWKDRPPLFDLDAVLGVNDLQICGDGNASETDDEDDAKNTMVPHFEEI